MIYSMFYLLDILISLALISNSNLKKSRILIELINEDQGCPSTPTLG